MQKGNVLIFLLVGIVVLGAIGGAFYLGRSTTPQPSPTPAAISQTPQPSSVSDETANWKTFAGTWFRFKYPPHWDLGDCGAPDIIYLDNEVVDCRGGLSEISVMRIDKEYSYLSDKSKGIVVEEKTIPLDGKNAVQVDFAADKQLSGLPYTVTEVVDGAVVYDIAFFSDGKPDETSNRNIYNQLVRTFKFIDPD